MSSDTPFYCDITPVSIVERWVVYCVCGVISTAEATCDQCVYHVGRSNSDLPTKAQANPARNGLVVGNIVSDGVALGNKKPIIGIKRLPCPARSSSFVPRKLIAIIAYTI